MESSLSDSKQQDRGGPSSPTKSRVYAGFQSNHRQLNLLINNLNQKAATNQRNHMLWSVFQMKQTYPQLFLSQDCPSIPLVTATLKHAVMQSVIKSWICLLVTTSIHPSWLSPWCHEQLPLSRTTLAPVLLDTGKVATTLLSQRLKCIYKFCQAETSLTMLVQAEVKSCYGANPEQELQCTALLLALDAHNTLGPCEAVQKAGSDPEQPNFQPHQVELSWL